MGNKINKKKYIVGCDPAMGEGHSVGAYFNPETGVWELVTGYGTKEAVKEWNEVVHQIYKEIWGNIWENEGR